MKILVMTRSAWDDANSTGNTMTNIFSGYDSDKIANLYVREAKPNNKVCNKYFSISDKEIMRSFLSVKSVPGKYFTTHTESTKQNDSIKSEEKIYSYFRKKPSLLALVVQNIMWKMDTWKNDKLDKFLDDFQPDVIFSPSFHTSYTHRILWYLKEKTNARIVLFHADDYLTVNEDSNFVTRLNEIKRAKVIKKSLSKADINYCISNKQQYEYTSKTGKEMKLLYKGADFAVNQPAYIIPREDVPVKIVYIGSILYGRWKTLSLLAKEIKKINQGKEKRFELIIYSQYELTKEMKEKMIIEGASVFKGKIAPEKIQNVYNDSDIVLHVESFDEAEKQKTRLSFSTKIVDCLNSGRTMMAIGWREAASIDYLISNDASLVATNESEVASSLNKINKNRDVLKEYANKGWACGKKNHEISAIQSNLYKDLQTLIGK